MSTDAWVRRSGWQSGIRSEVRLAPMIPAMRAVSKMLPLGVSPLRIFFITAVPTHSTASASASRKVSALALTSTMRGKP